MYRAVSELEVAALATAFIADHDRRHLVCTKSTNAFFLGHIIEIAAELGHRLLTKDLA